MKTAGNCKKKKPLIQAQMIKKKQSIQVGKRRNKTIILKGRSNYITVISKFKDGRLVAPAFPQYL
jgi:hypothetical protein